MDKKKDLDDFWDIDDMIPKKKHSSVSKNTTPVEINVSKAAATDSGDRALTDAPTKEKALHRATELVYEYEPGNPLIKKVRLYKWPTSYNYYEKFKNDARYFFFRTGEECEYTPFFSYIPQYHHLTKSQFAFYLWFRDRARCGEYIFCDFSYIMLYIYELINIPDMMEPKDTLTALIGLWRAYRDRFPRLDKYLVEWVCDFCLINALTPDVSELEPIYKNVVEAASFKEFYSPAAKDTREAFALSAMASLSGYDFKKSKYATGENTAIFEEHIVGALGFAIDENRLFDSAKKQTATVRRDSFGGSLCASNVKRVIEVEYHSLSGSYELRSIITNAVKYAENAVRASLGIKSRFGNLTLPTGVRESIDRYIAANLIGKRSTKKEIPEYERRYEMPVTPISSENAKDIELSSWKTTKLLVDAFEEEHEKEIAPVAPIAEPMPAGEDVYADLISILSEDEIDFIKLALSGDTASQTKLSQKLAKPMDVIAELINSSAADICGDIILESAGDGFALIEDYREDIAKWIKQTTV